ncbi:hypothetical protein VIGAN_08079500, partial [Vigna angularis var. angularis]
MKEPTVSAYIEIWCEPLWMNDDSKNLIVGGHFQRDRIDLSLAFPCSSGFSLISIMRSLRNFPSPLNHFFPI